MPCGIGDYTFALAGALARQNIDVALFTSAGAAPCPDSRIVVFPNVEHWDRKALTELKISIAEWQPDLVHFQYPTQGYGIGWASSFIPLAATSTGTRVVCTWHELPVPRGVPRFLVQSMGGGPIIIVRPEFYSDMSPILRNILPASRFKFIASASPIPQNAMSDEQRERKNAKWKAGAKRLVVYFGFLYPHKGVDQLFSVCDPATDHVVISGKFDPHDTYHAQLKALAESATWKGKVTFTGFLPDREVADLLSAADAVVLPFTGGGGEWNTSLLSARKQGTFVIITSAQRRGYDAGENTFYAAPGDVSAMRDALQKYSGVRNPQAASEDDWHRIAREHVAVYQRVLESR